MQLFELIFGLGNIMQSLSRRTLTSMVRIRNRESPCQKNLRLGHLMRRAMPLSKRARRSKQSASALSEIGLSVYLNSKFCSGGIRVEGKPPAVLCHMRFQETV